MKLLLYSIFRYSTCRQFTPILTKFYKLAKPLGVEIVFISSDQNEKSFEEYYKKMPWCAVPYNSKVIRFKLKKKFQIRGIPSVIVMDGINAKYIKDNGRDDIFQIQGGEIEVRTVVKAWKNIKSVPLHQARFTSGPGLFQQLGLTLMQPVLFLIMFFLYKQISPQHEF